MPFLLPFMITRPEGRVHVVLEVFEEDGEAVCGLRWISGELVGGPKAVVRAIREELNKIEQIARSAGVVEMRHAGDEARARIFSDYEPCPGLPNGLRKRL